MGLAKWVGECVGGTKLELWQDASRRLIGRIPSFDEVDDGDLFLSLGFE